MLRSNKFTFRILKLFNIVKIREHLNRFIVFRTNNHKLFN